MNKRTGHLLLYLALLATFLIYLQTRTFQFVYDDTDLIVKNPAVHSWAAVPSYFTHDISPYRNAAETGNFYRPLLLCWLLINYQLFGLNPAGWHLMVVLAHLFATLLTFFLVRQLTWDEWVAGSAALIFGLHPVHLEAVAWVSGVSEPLLAVLLISAFLCFVKSLGQNGLPKTKRVYWLAASLVLYFLATLVKETALVLPAFIFLYRWLFRIEVDETASDARKQTLLGRVATALLSATPYLLLTAIYLVMRFVALNGFSHALTRLPLATILFTWPSILWFYIRSLVWPLGLSAFYDTPYVTAPDLRHFILPLLVVIAIASGLFWWAKSSRVVAFFSLWLLLPVLPLLNISVFKEGDIAHDRYLYLPSVGFCVLVALVLRKLPRGRGQILGQSSTQVAAVLVLGALLGLATVYQSLYWTWNPALYARGVEIAPHNYIAANNLATELAASLQYDEAVAMYRQALDNNPAYWLSNFNLGYLYYKLGKLPEAESYLKKAISIDPREADQYRFLGFTQLELGRTNEAEAALRKAIGIKPEAPDQHLALGTILRQKGDLKGAVQEFKLELALNPNQTEARRQIADIEGH